MQKILKNIFSTKTPLFYTFFHYLCKVNNQDIIYKKRQFYGLSSEFQGLRYEEQCNRCHHR